MKMGNKVGLFAVALECLAALIGSGDYVSHLAFLACIAGQCLAFVMFIYAAIKGSRWWFASQLRCLVFIFGL